MYTLKFFKHYIYCVLSSPHCGSSIDSIPTYMVSIPGTTGIPVQGGWSKHRACCGDGVVRHTGLWYRCAEGQFLDRQLRASPRGFAPIARPPGLAESCHPTSSICIHTPPKVRALNLFQRGMHRDSKAARENSTHPDKRPFISKRIFYYGLILMPFM